jgi:fatty-acyl-CoA synthase
MNRLLSSICERADQAPDATFAWVKQDGDYEVVTQRRMLDESLRFAAWLRSQGTPPGAVVFVILRHCRQLYSAYLGAMLAGAVPSFLPFPNPRQDPALYWQAQREVFERTGAVSTLTYTDLMGDIEAIASEIGMAVLDVAGLDALLAPDTGARDTGGFRGEDEVALLQHSSGTTGLKKGVALSYGAITEQIESYAEALDLHAQLPAARIASWLPLYHDMGLIACFMLPAYLGIPVISLDAFAWANRPALLLEAIDRFEATHVWLPNFAFQHLVRATPRDAEYDLSSLVALISCSEPVKAETLDLFLDRFGNCGIDRESLKACYAMAETVFAVSQSPPVSAPAEVEVDGSRTVSNGPPIPGMSVRVTRNGEAVDEGDVGEISVRAPYVFSGYYEDPEATARSFDGDWYRTGDLGFLRDGEVYVTGRTKDLLIINGVNYFAHDIEAAVNAVDGVRPGRCAALGVYNPAMGSEQLVLVAERADGANPADDPVAAQRINRAVWERFGIGAADVRVVDPGWIVKTTSGKVSRSENVAKYSGLRDDGVEQGDGVR